MKNGYSKIQKSRSIGDIDDDSDLIASPDQQGDDDNHIHGAESGTDITDTGSVVLRRNCSVSTRSSTSSGFQSAVKRALLMRRSSSVSESYSRIHISLASPPIPIDDDDDDDVEEEGGIGNISTTTSVIAKKKKIRGGRGNIFKACKRLFGLLSKSYLYLIN